MLKITLVRHGETDGNKEKKYLGWTDIELNEKGILQAKIVRDKLSEEKFDLIISSPLKRAKATAEIIGNTNIIYEDNLKEINFGLFDNLSYKEIRAQYPEECEKWINNNDFTFPHGESFSRMYTRVQNFVDKIKTKEGSILVVTHSGIIRSIIAYLLNMEEEKAWHFSIDNCGITVIDITKGYAVLRALNK
ncbi:alpha-ribazole phosphatase [Clostridium felsineum]|uniref:alpha-ribazole phosphatase n=1 Tax=Clostridium felsineum TaxID=36839 RepID=UPI00098BE670|nr:alpha-ribazole phosphatase [Clostridium felsineum]URZ15902.1 Phosphoserine phosphatase 1 [Clostridium felsineum DSM 794]